MERFCFTYVKSYIIEEQFSVFNISLFILRYITYFTLFLHLPFLTFIDAAEPLLCSQSRLVTSCHWIDVFLVWLRLETHTQYIQTDMHTPKWGLWHLLSKKWMHFFINPWCLWFVWADALSPCGVRSWKEAQWDSWLSPVCRTWTPHRSSHPDLSLASHLKEDTQAETVYSVRKETHLFCCTTVLSYTYNIFYYILLRVKYSYCTRKVYWWM